MICLLIDQLHVYNSNTINDSFHTPKQIENKSNVNSLFENSFKSCFIYADFSYQRESFDKFIHLIHTQNFIFFPISVRLGKQIIKKWPFKIPVDKISA